MFLRAHFESAPPGVPSAYFEAFRMLPQADVRDYSDQIRRDCYEIFRHVRELVPSQT